jgi:hypothetical protein
MRINLLFSEIPYLTKLVVRFKNGDFNFSEEIPTWVRLGSKLSNRLREDIEKVFNDHFFSSLIMIHHFDGDNSREC